MLRDQISQALQILQASLVSLLCLYSGLEDPGSSAAHVWAVVLAGRIAQSFS